MDLVLEKKRYFVALSFVVVCIFFLSDVFLE